MLAEGSGSGLEESDTTSGDGRRVLSLLKRESVPSGAGFSCYKPACYEAVYSQKSARATISLPDYDVSFLGCTEISTIFLCGGLTCRILIPDQRFASVPGDSFYYSSHRAASAAKAGRRFPGHQPDMAYISLPGVLEGIIVWELHLFSARCHWTNRGVTGKPGIK